jgi:hypothetical protein
MGVKFTETHHFLRKKKRKRKNCKGSGVDKDLMKFPKIPMFESL